MWLIILIVLVYNATTHLQDSYEYLKIQIWSCHRPPLKLFKIFLSFLGLGLKHPPRGQLDICSLWFLVPLELTSLKGSLFMLFPPSPPTHLSDHCWNFTSLERACLTSRPSLLIAIYVWNYIPFLQNPYYNHNVTCLYLIIWIQVWLNYKLCKDTVAVLLKFHP